MTKMKHVAGIPDTHPQTLEDIANIKLYHPFEWHNAQLRVVPCDANGTGEVYPCRGCFFSKARSTLRRCPAMVACTALVREDKVPVKFISADLSVLNYDEELREKVAKIDSGLRW